MVFQEKIFFQSTIIDDKESIKFENLYFLNQLSKKLNECFKQKSEKKKTNKILL